MFESGELGDSPQKEFLTHFPAVDLPSKQYSLEADFATGWRPKNRILGPIPLNCDARLLDEIVQELTSFGSRHRQRVVYLGFRFASSFKMHQEMRRHYLFKHEGALSSNYQHMAAYFRKFHNNFKSKHTPPFKGMNPTIKQGQQLQFDSNFQGGNLDAVIKVGENEYDLYVRVDTNTRGHLQWFHFVVRNCGKRKVRFNIVNFRKAKTLYQRGMKPYIFSEYLRQTKDVGWSQAGDNVRYQRKALTYDFLPELYDDEDHYTYNCLSFDYTFDVDWEEVHFAYTPPFSYSDLNEMLLRLKQTVAAQLAPAQETFLTEDVLCESLAGLEIPILTITDPEVETKHKKCVLVSGRIHPGESCGSFMGRGLLEYICGPTEQAKFLRKHVVFKVIPMLNPDGVVIGNYRTSLCGRDLNRTFKMGNDFLIPEVKALKELASKLKAEFKSRLMFFFDLHGHSVKKNVFLYGPEYDIWETNYYKTRIFPKIIANKTPMFRYYSCLFRVSEFKRTTARAVLLRTVPHCYTIQASAGFYFCPVQKKDVAFTPQKWMQMGRYIAQGIKQFIEVLQEESISKQQRKQKLISLKNMKTNNRGQSKKNSEKLSINKFQTRIVTNSAQKGKHAEESPEKRQEEPLSKKARDLIESIKEDDRKFQEEGADQGHESDQFSEGGSDSQSAGEDLSPEDMKSFEDDIFAYMQEYREKYYREKADRQFSMKEKKKPREMEEGKLRKESKGIELIASLRKKAEQLEKAREVLVWTRAKEDFREVKRSDESFYPRTTLSRIEALPGKGPRMKIRRAGIESELIDKEDAQGLREVRHSK